ncbi:MAG: protein kinase, partial [Deltaproteobacteria bacterium]|nr:protein kinase [Kofleriaceae bacterium]
LDVAAQLARALAAAHAAGIVHRDLKPANVMLRRASGRAVIVDFGIAKWAGEAATSASRCAGTPHYMAPEQALGEDVDEKADLYALGCVMVRMLTGRVPYDGTAVEVMLAHAAQPVPRVEGVGAELAALVEQLMAKRPEERPASAAWVAARLEQLARPRPASSSEPEWTTTVPVHATRRGWLAGVLVAAAIVGVSGFAMSRPTLGEVVEAEAPALPPLVLPEPTAPGEPVAVVVDSGHSMRATTIGEPIAGGAMKIKLEIWDEDDEPIDAGEVAATIRAPGGRTFALGVPGTNGVFELAHPTADAGTHLLTVFAPSGETTFTVRVEVGPRPGA